MFPNFKKFFPEGTIHLADSNLGVCYNFKRSEEYMFDHYDRVVFMQDDCIPVPFYLEYIHDMAETFKNDERVGGIGGWTNSELGVEPNGQDLVQGPRRFFQYRYALRLIGEDYFGLDVELPPLELRYRIELLHHPL